MLHPSVEGMNLKLHLVLNVFRSKRLQQGLNSNPKKVHVVGW